MMDLNAFNRYDRIRQEFKVKWWHITPVLTIALIWKIIKEL